MHALSGTRTAPALQALLRDGTLAGEWVLDPRRSSIQVKTRAMWGMARVTGIFREVTGSGVVSAEGEVGGTLVVDAGSIDTDNPRRDNHLRSPDFFDSDRNPQITFTTAEVRPSGQVVSLTGRLTVRGVTRPVSFEAATSVQDGELTIDAELPLDRTEFGLRWGRRAGIVATRSLVTVHAVFTRL